MAPPPYGIAAPMPAQMFGGSPPTARASVASGNRPVLPPKPSLAVLPLTMQLVDDDPTCPRAT